MPTFSNAGGSLGSAVILTLLAWGVRWVRSEMMKRKDTDGLDAKENYDLSPYHCQVSVATLLGLIETRACKYILIDVRPFSSMGSMSEDDNDMNSEQEVLPGELHGAVRLPFDLVGDVLKKSQAWESTFPHVKFPDTFQIFVLIGSNEYEEFQAASALNALGYQRTMCVKGSLGAFYKDSMTQSTLHYISRDGLALLLSEECFDPAMEVLRREGSYVLIDVRRRDEIILFGGIAGSRNIPVDELCSALSNSDSNFEQMYHFPKPSSDMLLIMCSRTHARATWAAQMAHDAGYSKVAVYAQGVNGWMLDPAVNGYTAYELGDVPPDPVEYEAQMIDHSHGMAEVVNMIELIQQQKMSS
ncbi:hypothetical protein M9434_006869 [Picochlorum sp. BPE23]|nr:hypothetical protein M9434_006869 [Picochlorum sp. BPE23]